MLGRLEIEIRCEVIHEGATDMVSALLGGWLLGRKWSGEVGVVRVGAVGTLGYAEDAFGGVDSE